MENRVTEKHIKVNGREFILRKFTPFFGVYLATQTFSNIVGSKNKLMALVQSIMSKPKEEFIKLQQDVLSYCFEILPAGPTAVVDTNGNFAVMNIDGPLALNLFTQTLLFSMMDFFTDEVMESLTLGMENILEEHLPSPQKI